MMSSNVINIVDVIMMKPLSMKQTENLASVSPRYEIASLASNRSALQKEDVVRKKISGG